MLVGIVKGAQGWMLDCMLIRLVEMGEGVRKGGWLLKRGVFFYNI